jgi:hypothetical protein
METAIPITAALVFVALFLLERFLPLRQPTRSLWHRLLVNLVMTGLAFLVAALLPTLSQTQLPYPRTSIPAGMNNSQIVTLQSNGRGRFD